MRRSSVPFDLVADVRAATRALTKRPAAALTVIVTLARATAINAAVFAVVRCVRRATMSFSFCIPGNCM